MCVCVVEKCKLVVTNPNIVVSIEGGVCVCLCVCVFVCVCIWQRMHFVTEG